VIPENSKAENKSISREQTPVSALDLLLSSNKRI